MSHTCIEQNAQIRLVRELGIIAFITAIGLAIRLPFFFPAVIDWDESTFIIIGQSTVDGFLPYQIAWDGKPPFLFWWFGAAIELFGKTIPAVRFAGFLWLVLSAYLLYWAAFSITRNRLGGLFAAGMFIVASSAYALNVSTEHLALLPMTGALLVLLDGGRQLRSVFLGGLLLGLACMFRLNLVYLCLITGLFLCSQGPYASLKSFLYRALKKGAWFSVGVLLPTLLGFLPYLLSGHSQLWVTVYEAAVSYSGEQRSFANVAYTLRESSTGFVGATMWGAAILGAFIISRRWRDLCPERQSNWLLCATFVLGSFLSIVMTGPVYRHYFVQLAPGLSMFAAATFIPLGKACSVPSSLSKIDSAKFVFGSVLIALAIFQTADAGWRELTRRLWADEPLSYGEEYEIADFIRSQGTEDYSLFMMDDNLVYWLLGRYPPTLLATHPSALGKPFVRRYLEPNSVTTEDALRSVFLREPTFVVWRPNLFYLSAADVRFLEQELMTDYVLVGQIGSQQEQVFRRTAHTSVGVSAPK
jgi:4-amino-4-deoxy-L-arabinose transferase-like glycosyltransferase